MKNIIEKILLKLGYVPIREIRKAELKINAQWKLIILNPILLPLEQMVAREEKEFAKALELAFLYGSGTRLTKKVKNKGGKKK